jgi:tRNA A-37 threonylcarbamoyl transferase component Bud32
VLATRESSHHGFRVVQPVKYEQSVSEEAFETWIAHANRLSSDHRSREPLWLGTTLETIGPVYVKYWIPRREFYRAKTLWRRCKLERELEQYRGFLAAGLPVPDLVLCAVKRLPGPCLGLFLTGFIVTRLLSGARNLVDLLRKRISPWRQHGVDRTAAVLSEIARLLVRTHRARLVHGDYMLKNVVYAPGGADKGYHLVDLGSGWSLPDTDPTDASGRLHDLLRMVLSLARNRLSRGDVMVFLEAYSQHYNHGECKRSHAEELLEHCLALPDRRAEEAARLLELPAAH